MYYRFMEISKTQGYELEDEKPVHHIDDNFHEGAMTQVVGHMWTGSTQLELADGSWSTIQHEQPRESFYLPSDVYEVQYTGNRKTEMQFDLEDHDEDVDVYAAKEAIIVCVGSLTVHVDDLLATGSPSHAVLDTLHRDAEKQFGKVKRQGNTFRHYGMDVTQLCSNSFDAMTVMWSQYNYLSAL